MTLENNKQKKPLISFFLHPYPSSLYKDEEIVIFNPISKMNESPNGIPLFMMARTSRPPTSCTTPGHRIKAGYTRSGKYRPSKWMPQKTDKRVGR